MDRKVSPWPAWLLSAVAGSVDGIGFLALGHLFIAHMSGNTAAAGAYVGNSSWGEAARRFWPVPIFFLGVLLGAILVEFCLSRLQRYAVVLPLAIEFLLLCAFGFLGQETGRRVIGTDIVGLSIGGLACFAMGIQNAALARVGKVNVRTTYITGMLTDLAEEIARKVLWRTGNDRAPRITIWSGIWVSYFISACCGAVLFTSVRFWSVLLPLTLLAGVLVKELVHPIRAESTILD